MFRATYCLFQLTSLSYLRIELYNCQINKRTNHNVIALLGKSALRYEFLVRALRTANALTLAIDSNDNNKIPRFIYGEYI